MAIPILLILLNLLLLPLRCILDYVGKVASYVFFLTFINFEREREHGRGGAEREGEGESQAGSMLSAELDMGLDLKKHKITT